MKYAFLSLIIGLILIAGVFFVIQQGNVSPYNISKLQELIDKDKIGENDYEVFNEAIDNLVKTGQIENYIESSSITIFLVTTSLGLLLTFVGLHSIIDKLFFKKFFENPNFKIAFRRGLFFTSAILSIFYLRFYRVEWNTAVLVIPFVLVLELTIAYFTASRKVEEIEKDEPDEPEAHEGEIDEDEDDLLAAVEEEITSSFALPQDQQSESYEPKAHRGEVEEGQTEVYENQNVTQETEEE